MRHPTSSVRNHSGRAPISRRAPRTQPDIRRRQILDKAEELLEKHGSDGLRMDSVARAAGVTRPVVYEHFANRDALIIALLERHSLRMTEHDGVLDPSRLPFGDLLREATRSYLVTACAHGPAMRALVSGEHLSPKIETVRRKIWHDGTAKWCGLYKDAFGISESRARALAISHLAGLSALAGYCIDGGMAIDHAVDVHVAASLGALRGVAGMEPLP